MSKCIELTEEVIATAPAPSMQWDSVVRGFGLERKANGIQRYLCQCDLRARGAGQHKLRFGNEPLVGPDGLAQTYFPGSGLWPLEYARQRARKWLAQMRAGGSAPQPRPKAPHQPKRRHFDNSRIIEDVAEHFIHLHLHGMGRAPGYQRDASAILRRRVVPHWKGRDIRKIKRPEIVAFLEGVKAECVRRGGNGVQANRVKSIMAKMFSWAMNRGLVEHNPCAGMDRPAKEQRRDRELSDVELAAVWWGAKYAFAQCRSGYFGYPWRQCVRLHLLTGQRVREVAEARWDEIDLDAATWTFSKNKARRKHIVPLSPQALEVLVECQKQRRGDFVFMSGINGNAPIRGLVKPKKRLDARCGVTDWVLEDFRQTCASGMLRLEVEPHVIAACLNHAPKDVTMRHYISPHAYAKPKREAFERWGRYVAEIVARYPLPLTAEEARAEELLRVMRAHPPGRLIA